MTSKKAGPAKRYGAPKKSTTFGRSVVCCAINILHSDTFLIISEVFPKPYLSESFSLTFFPLVRQLILGTIPIYRPLPRIIRPAFRTDSSPAADLPRSSGPPTAMRRYPCISAGKGKESALERSLYFPFPASYFRLVAMPPRM